MNEYKKKVDDLLVKIDDILFSEEPVIPSLYMGDLGRVLYFSYRYLQTKDEKYSKIAKELLEELVNNSNNYVLDSSLGNGITG